MVMYSPETRVQSAALHPMYQGVFGAVRVTGGSDWNWLKGKNKTTKKPTKKLGECFDLK